MNENEDKNVTKLDLSNVKATEVDDNVTKLNLNETAEETTSSTADETGVDGSNEATVTTPEQEEVQQEVETQESVVEEITSEEVAEAVEEAQATGKVLPEAADKLVKFMDETGGDIQDYLRLNRNLEELSPNDALLEYYRETKPHLDDSELSFLMEDQFSYDEEYDDEKDIMRKKLAIKEETSRAKSYLENKKSKYYEEIKNGSNLTPEAN